MTTRRRFHAWVLAQSPSDLVKFAVLLAATGGYLCYYMLTLDESDFRVPDVQPWRALWLGAVIVPMVSAIVGLMLGLAHGWPARRVSDIGLFYTAWAFALGAGIMMLAWWVTGVVAVFRWANSDTW